MPDLDSLMTAVTYTINTGRERGRQESMKDTNLVGERGGDLIRE